MARLRLVSVLAAVAALSFALLVGPAQAEHAWGNYHWARTTSSFTLQSVDSVTADWQSEYGDALTQWSDSAVLDVQTTSADDGSRTRKRCQPVSGKMRVCNAAYGQNGWLGLAQIWLDGPGHITQGLAKMNDSYGWYFAANPGEKSHVMCQEIGHVFGLGHTSEDGSSQQTCMDYSNDPRSTAPNTHDYQELAAIYGHTDGYDSYAKIESGGGNDGGNDPKPCNPKSPKCNANGVDGREFGQLVSSSEHHQLWMRRGPGGVIVLTHIRLAPR